MLHTVKRNDCNVKRNDHNDKQNDYNAKWKDYNVQRNDYNCAAGFALLNLPKGKSLGRSKPATNSSNEQAH